MAWTSCPRCGMRAYNDEGPAAVAATTKETMKPRRVFVTLEIETEGSLKKLRDSKWWSYQFLCMPTGYSMSCVQAQANVAKSAAAGTVRHIAKGRRKARRKA